MSIRSNSRPLNWDLSPEFQDMLRRNGMQAHIVRQGEAYMLFVQGHDSPMLNYNLNDKQTKALTDWGTNYANKSAYDTFVNIVDKDFYLPRNFVHARNANGRVAMGLHGYRVGVGEYGRMPYDRYRMYHFFGPDFLGWTPRSQEGFHMRRIGNAMFMQEGAPIIAERPDRRINPGELSNGGYGFYYKGQQNKSQDVRQDVLQDLQTVLKPVETYARPKSDAVPYKELITSPVYFSNEKFQECLKSHGIIVDAESKTMTIQSASVSKDLVYDLTDEEVKSLTSNSIKESPVEKRLDIINDIIKEDYDGKITMGTLNSRHMLDIPLKPETVEQLDRQEAIVENFSLKEEIPEVEIEKEDKNSIHINGNMLYDLNENKAWYREGRHGREVFVDDIKAEAMSDGKYKMTAVINGESVSHEISQKQYDKFAAIDDYHRLKLFSRVFDELDMKTIPGRDMNVTAALLAGAAVTSEVASDILGSHYEPDIFVEHYNGPHVYFKEGVDSPQDLAARAFDAGLNAGETGVGLGHQR